MPQWLPPFLALQFCAIVLWAVRMDRRLALIEAAVSAFSKTLERHDLSTMRADVNGNATDIRDEAQARAAAHDRVGKRIDDVEESIVRTDEKIAGVSTEIGVQRDRYHDLANKVTAIDTRLEVQRRVRASAAGGEPGEG